jgi:methionine-rich copper-binding protein CopC
VAAAVAGLAVAPPAPAHAQGSVATSSPVAGATVASPPPVVTLRMGHAVDGAVATVTDGCGRRVPGTVVVAGARVSIRLAVGVAHSHLEAHSAAAGTWLVDWRTVTHGGRPESGRLRFALAGDRRCDTGTTAGTRADAQPAVRPAAPGPAAPRGLLLALYAVAGAGVVLTGVRLVARRRSPAPDPAPRQPIPPEHPPFTQGATP